MRGHNPEWANLPRRKCDDCGKSYKPSRPLKQGQRGFCKPGCRKEYHKHGGAYRQLKGRMEKLVEAYFKKLEDRQAEHQAEALKRFDSIWEELQRIFRTQDAQTANRILETMKRKIYPQSKPAPPANLQPRE